jgi:hypothetical protein
MCYSTAVNHCEYLSSRCDESFEMVAEEVIPPLLSVEEAISPDDPDSGCVKNKTSRWESSKL